MIKRARNRSTHQSMTLRMKLLWLSACFLGTAWLLLAADLRVEIAPGPSKQYPIQVRVVGGDPEAQYWIERSDDAGKTWEEYIRCYTGDWWYVSVTPKASMFRAKLMAP